MYNWILDFSLEYSRDEYLGLCFFFGSLTETQSNHECVHECCYLAGNYIPGSCQAKEMQ
jgi:hypothetical protein